MINAEKKLWQNVLLTAINDALSYKKEVNSVYGVKIAEDAKNWLLNNNTHYFRVCSMADINPLGLREKLKKKLFAHNVDSEDDNKSEFSWNIDLYGVEGKQINL